MHHSRQALTLTTKWRNEIPLPPAAEAASGGRGINTHATEDLGILDFGSPLPRRWRRHENGSRGLVIEVSRMGEDREGHMQFGLMLCTLLTTWNRFSR
jgi:hypothetical protein